MTPARRRLRLHKQTVRVLSDAELGVVAGGGTVPYVSRNGLWSAPKTNAWSAEVVATCAGY